MSANKYKPYVSLIPEDDANRQLALGFLDHPAVTDLAVELRAPAGGWGKVLEVFEIEYVPSLRKNANAHVVMLIDFDDADDRRVHCEQRIPEDLRSRVFVVGSKNDPETLRVEVGIGLEAIGRELAQDCLTDSLQMWNHAHLVHNRAELNALNRVVKPILFP